MTVADDGTVYVGTRRGEVYSVKNGKVSVLAKGLNSPNGVALKDGDLYVAEIHRLIRFKGAGSSHEVLCSFPDKRHHGWKYIKFGPDGRLYVPIGAPSNADEHDLPFCTLNRMSEDYKSYKPIARGIRNTVGFDWHPVSKELWFTDNGRDWLGDDLPPEELNVITAEGLHFGFPYRYGNNVPDPQMGAKAAPGQKFTPMRHGFPAHVAALGMDFYTGAQFPAEWKNRIFVAFHGSWNRSKPIGYEVVWVQVKPDGTCTHAPFVSGFLSESGKVSGRPVDVVTLKDGSILISDDHGGKLWRVSYGK